jgi:uncharacterized protein
MIMIKFRKPILILGLGLSLTFGLWDFWQHSFPLSDYTLLGAIAFGSIFWSLRKKSQSTLTSPTLSTIDQKAVIQAITQAETTINYLEQEAPEANISLLKQQLNVISNSLTRSNLNIAITGDKRVGKTALTQLLSQENKQENITFFDRPEAYSADDLVIFVINGDLTASQAQIIQQLTDFKHQLLITLNKQDQYSSEERSQILAKIRSSLNNLIATNDIISISAAPSSIKVKKYLQNGTSLETIQTQLPEITDLNYRLNEIIKTQTQQLIFATSWRQAKVLEKQTQNQLNQVRNNRSQPVIEQYQWIAATAAFANPVSSLDLLATAAINTQMLVDLAQIYQQKMSLDQAHNAAVTIAKVMVKLGIVELSIQAIATILKSNAITYIAGGFVQGISAAYLTRIAGLSLIAYYEEQGISNPTGSKLNLDTLSTNIKNIFTDNQKTNLLPNLVTQILKNPQLNLNN